MRAGEDYSDMFQTNEGASDEKNTHTRAVDEGPRRSPTSGIRLDGRKGENELPRSVVNNRVTEALERALKSWTMTGDAPELRSELLRVLLDLTE